MKSLIVYGTRYGATAGTSEEIAKVLRKEGFSVRVVDAKEEKVEDISEYDLIIVASGIRMGRWTKEPERFLKKFQEELARKKVAIFVSSLQGILESDNPQAIEEARRKYLQEKADKYALRPIAMTLFGGVFPIDHLGWMLRKTLAGESAKFEAAGYEKVDGT
ncbi:MAG: flavodoxin domain-containing protein, partial [Promethearchaeota archaeon]